MKIFLTISKYFGAISVITIATWGVFKWVDNRQDSEADFSKTIYDEVVPKLDYLVKADSANRARDEALLNRIDSTRLVVDALARKRTEDIVNDSTLTKAVFLEEMRPFMEYLDDIKKKNSQNGLMKPSAYFLGSDIPIPPRDTEVWRIPSEWLPKLNTSLRTMGRLNSPQ